MKKWLNTAGSNTLQLGSVAGTHSNMGRSDALPLGRDASRTDRMWPDKQPAATALPAAPCLFQTRRHHRTMPNAPGEWEQRGSALPTMIVNRRGFQL